MTETIGRKLINRLLFVSTLVVSACTLTLPTRQPPLTTVSPPALAMTEEQEVRALLWEVPRFVVLGAEEGKQEQQAASVALARGPNEMARLRLALLLSLGVGGRSDVRLQALLDEPESRAGANDSPRQQLWSLLHRMNSERIRFQHEAQQRADARIRENDLHVREAQARVDDLQKKLDALKSVERTINKRSHRPEKDQP